jgi:ABC-type multidrug transport system ATPase subunit
MMTISLSDAGKRFNREWIFHRLHYTFRSGSSYAITGPNGSGKSTLLQVIAGSISTSEGSIEYSINDKKYESDAIYRQMSVAAPYLELVEELTLREFLDFHGRFKPWLPGLDTASIIRLLSLEKAAGKQLRYYSSGMKQRVKLAQAIFSNTALLLLDEPSTNLDKEGILLYHQLIKDYTANRLVIVSSNDTQEYDFCKEVLNIMDYK